MSVRTLGVEAANIYEQAYAATLRELKENLNNRVKIKISPQYCIWAVFANLLERNLKEARDAERNYEP